MSCVCAHRPGHSAPLCLEPEEYPETEILFRTCASRSPLKHKPTYQVNFGISVYCVGFLLLLLFGNFLVISLYLGDGVGRSHMQGSAPVLSQKPTGPPPPSCSICVQRAKCPPLPAKKKESPQPVKMVGGGDKEGMTASPLQSENPN